MLDAGYVIRLGRSEPIHHRASPTRSQRRVAVNTQRNELLISWTYFPFPWNVFYMVGYILRGIAAKVRVGRPWNGIVGVAAGLRACASRRTRHPISRAAFRFDQLARSRLRTAGGVRLAHAEAALGPLGPRPKPSAGGWPWPVRRLHAPLREARTKLIKRVGRPLRCEVCGQVLFRGLPFIWRGRLKLLGAEGARVRADWDKKNRMTFRHVERDRCEPDQAR